MAETEIKSVLEEELKTNMKQEIKTEVENVSLFTALRYGRIACNVSLALIALIAIIAHRNPSGIFAIIVYNGIHAFLVSLFQRYREQKFLLSSLRFHYNFNYSEMLAGQLSLLVGLLFMFMFGYLFLNSFGISNINICLGFVPFICLIVTVGIRYISYFVIRNDIKDKLLYGKY